MSQHGLFITLEGTEGVGKSSNIALINDMLDAAGQDHLLTREPGGTPLAERIRSVLVSPSDEEMAPLAELLLIFAARAQHLQQRVLPALQQGVWVICDRFTDASFAYQGAARGLGSALVEQLETLVQGDLRPDLTILLDAPVEVGMRRAGKRGRLDRFERERQAFFEKVRECYLQRAAQEPQRFVIVNADQPLDQVQGEIRAIIDELLWQQGKKS